MIQGNILCGEWPIVIVPFIMLNSLFVVIYTHRYLLYTLPGVMVHKAHSACGLYSHRKIFKQIAPL